MLDMRPNCEICDCDLPPNSPKAMICSFECTFCTDCTDCIKDDCPNCGGNVQKRPTRVGKALERHPASTARIHRAK